MVIVQLIGGLGNQMFQYAFGLWLANERNTELITNAFLLDNKVLARLRNYTSRNFELSVFGIDKPRSSPFDFIRAILPVKSNTALLREPRGGSTALSLPPSTVERVVCIGYWQSEEYFKSAESIIRQKFTFQQPVNAFTQRITESVQNSQQPVFVHVRRGDYVTNANASHHHGVCGPEYYKHAIAYVRERVQNPHFYVFSDDLAWVKHELGFSLNPVTYVDGHRGRDSWQDMFLMSQCRHAILANSSFSWWGAWLNPEAERIVVAPQKWFVTKSADSVLPDRWIKI